MVVSVQYWRTRVSRTIFCSRECVQTPCSSGSFSPCGCVVAIVLLVLCVRHLKRWDGMPWWTEGTTKRNEWFKRRLSQAHFVARPAFNTQLPSVLCHCHRRSNLRLVCNPRCCYFSGFPRLTHSPQWYLSSSAVLHVTNALETAMASMFTTEKQSAVATKCSRLVKNSDHSTALTNSCH